MPPSSPPHWATAAHWDGAADARSSSAKHADAVFDIVAFFNANHASEGTPRNRPHVEMQVQLEPPQPAGSGGEPDLVASARPVLAPHAVTADGQLLASWATDAFLCDCVIHRVLRAGASVVDYGRAVRTVPAPLWRAVASRDGGCRFPDCDRKVAWCDAHHVTWWRNGGDTKLDNLMLLCARHHHLVHSPGWTVRLLATAEAQFVTPDDRHLSSRPRGQPTIRAA